MVALKFFESFLDTVIKMSIINWKIIMLSHIVMWHNRQKREGQGISQNFKAKNATFMDLILKKSFK